MKYILLAVTLAFSSMSFAGPKIDINHHNQNFKGSVKSSNYNKASNYSNNKASASNYNHSYTNSDSKAKSNSQAKSNSGAYNGGNNVNVEGDDYDLPANSVPVSIGGICTDAAAAQGMNGGVSISRANPVCEKLKMHEVYMKLGMKEEALKSLKDAEALSDVRAFFRGTLTVLTLGIL